MLLNAGAVLFQTIQYLLVFARDLYSTTRNPDTFRSRSWNTINSTSHVCYLTAIQHGSQNTHMRVWNSAAIAKFHVSIIDFVGSF